MKNRRIVGFWSIAGVILTVGLLLLWESNTPNDARQRLDHLLGQADSTAANPAKPEPLTPNLPDPLKFPDEGSTLFGLPMPATDIAVEETSSAYVLRIPLAKAEDSSAVKVEVSPHRIEVSGQTGSQSEGQSVSSSFMQAFTTNQELLPNQVHRHTEQNGKQTELVITIAKKVGPGANSPAEDTTLEDALENETQDSPDNTSTPSLQPPPPVNDAPLDTYSNRMI